MQKLAGLLCVSLLTLSAAHAIEFRSISMDKTVLYDAPSAEAKKVFIVSNGYPVEVIVNLGEWIKIRDHYGALNWVQSKQLSSSRKVLVTQDKAEMRQSGNDSAALVATLAKDVVLELVSRQGQYGWIKVKHRDGHVGYVHSSALWGI